MSTRWGTVLLLALLGAWSRPAAAKTKYYGIVIGNNAAPARSEGAPHAPLSTLKFADDDAASMTAFLAEFGAETRLLTVMDADTQRRYPELVARARPPSLVELRRAIAEYAVSVARDERAGDESVLVFFFSGHGVDDVGERSFLSLLDAPLTQALLYDEILPHLPGRAVHLIVDACHAEAVVRPRDLNVGIGDVTEDDRARYRARWTLDRFPHVGAVIASNVSAQAQEWDRYRQGVFTHEVLSGLRGAADVNGDGRVEYSELEAFLAAANRSVRDDRARPSVLVRVPAIDARAPLVNLPSPMRRACVILQASSVACSSRTSSARPSWKCSGKMAFLPKSRCLRAIACSCARRRATSRSCPKRVSASACTLPIFGRAPWPRAVRSTRHCSRACSRSRSGPCITEDTWTRGRT